MARRNLQRSRNALADDDAEAIAFWAPQAIVFALKALLLNSGAYPPKAHSLIELESRVNLGLDGQLVAELSPYYAVSRHPNAFGGLPRVHKKTAEKFLHFAEVPLHLVKARL